MITYSKHVEHIVDAMRGYLERKNASRESIDAATLKKAEKFLFNKKDKSGKKKPLAAKRVLVKNVKARTAYGRVYSFIYNAKHKDTLPYYDRYPFVLVLSNNRKKRQFTGLNLHYIDPAMRDNLLHAIQHLYMGGGMDRYMTKDFFDDISRWARRLAKPCLHTYLIDKVRNLKFWQIPALLASWADCVRDETFIRAGVGRVWLDSRKKMFRGARWAQLKQTQKKAKARSMALAKERIAKAKAALKHRKMSSSAGVPSRKSKTAMQSKARTGKRYKSR